MTPEPTSRKCGATISRSICSSRVVGEREDGPVARGVRRVRLDLDAPHDAVRAGHGRDLEGRRRGRDRCRRPAGGRWRRRRARCRPAPARAAGPPDAPRMPSATRSSDRTRRRQPQHGKARAPAARPSERGAASRIRSPIDRSSGASREVGDARRSRPVFGEKRVEMVILPVAGDLEVVSQIALAPETGFFEKADRSRVGRAGRRPRCGAGLRRRRRRASSASTARCIQPAPAWASPIQ